ncbi:4-hydroxy-tetrahydrodipicolinate reductase [Ancylobacter amanitiformis]|uniref:4-hydroxy-tetrahydrodipicolinate reductase n=1 Tax=Ancylobacter amanitiformis TaxID=217069 RepID=A0ABU0LVD4_9HYPH|nr:4-hydroxy-tetrahydrodipicolinate reductase [Ancylobacter amanitiformis]MDQ0512663.1 4-hydroxy-tetrahydrodipicolinate reductase [Ancylobacter amanitiformis]
MTQMRLVVVGAGGRMGRTVIRAIAEAPDLVLSAAIDTAGADTIGRDVGELVGLPAFGVPVSEDALTAFAAAEGVIDFTIPQASIAYAALAAQARIAHVIGTTGLTAEDEAKIDAAARHAPIVKSGNMSLGVNLLAALVKRVARTLDEDFDIEVVEMHHRAKIDAPSGTALLLGRAAAEGRGVDLDTQGVFTRHGHTGARRPGDIGFATLRGGTVVGEHNVIFAGPAERIELAHKAEDRGIFARGAIAAARWARGRKPGLYSMADVLGLSDI